ncbi:MAG TPA: glutathione peroxidase [Planctomycetaceae bacterium]|nr:glutathione peroxidase [Planctomycetaceae bacterium]
MKSLTGKKVDLAKYNGKVLLIVNVASQCGYTKQYKPLEALHEKYNGKGLAVIGFPCNQFGDQEPGSDEDVAEFCQKNFGVKFDMFSKIDVNGVNAADLYKQLTSKETFAKDAGEVKWNFEKFLVSREGKVVARFRSDVEPNSDDVIKAIEKELAK